jgi:hypothetical protein
VGQVVGWRQASLPAAVPKAALTDLPLTAHTKSKSKRTG